MKTVNINIHLLLHLLQTVGAEQFVITFISRQWLLNILLVQ